jgi:hypothetical protein
MRQIEVMVALAGTCRFGTLLGVSKVGEGELGNTVKAML